MFLKFCVFIFIAPFVHSNILGSYIQEAAYSESQNPFLILIDGSESLTYKYYSDIYSPMQFFPYV